ncbi:pol-like protein ENS-3 [Grus japonensis]|uniref:Pol-like protein ENS-3 n=1 Tax=Grus japonensis TaxID=30415 RepID=A0ABC9YH59_GRUJA
MRYSDLEKGLLSLVRAVKRVEQIRKGQSVIIRGPFRLLDIVRKGTAPPAGIAQKPTVRKWYAYLESINDIMPITEGSIKVSKLQKDIDSTLLFQTPPSKPSPIQEAPPLKEGSDLKGVWFTDASSYRQNNEWNYKAVALEVATGEKLSETGVTGPPSYEQFTLTLPVQIHLGHFNLGSLIHLLVVLMFLSGLTLGYMGIYMTYLYN